MNVCVSLSYLFSPLDVATHKFPTESSVTAHTSLLLSERGFSGLFSNRVNESFVLLYRFSPLVELKSVQALTRVGGVMETVEAVFDYFL